MIQRIQSVYLLLNSIFGGLIFVFYLWKTEKKVYLLDLLSSNSLLLKSIPFLFILTLIVPFVTIFLYKNRQLQIIAGRLTILMNLALLIVFSFLTLTSQKYVSISEKGVAMFLPILSLILILLANKAIKKDEKLVKSINRLR